MSYDVVGSMFDGLSGTMIALHEKLGITPREYHAFEVDPYSSAVSLYNYPDIIRHGDARNWRNLKGKILDLFVAGFPCQSYSVAGLRQFQDDPRDMSKVLLDALRGLAIDKVLIENVASMPSEWRDYFTKIFKDIFPDIECYELNSANDSAQNRKRLYWTNIKFTRSEDKGIVLNDILEDGGMADRDKSYSLDANYFKGGNLTHYYKRKRRQVVFDKNACKQVGEADLKGYDIIRRVYSRQGKSPTLTTMQGGWRMPKVECGQIINRKINPETGKRDDYNPNIKAEPRIETRSDGKTNTLSTVQKDNVVVNHEQMYWRALTPLECERLQTIPDKYTEYGAFPDKKVTWYTCNRISNSQRYKMLGNGFCVDTVADILKGEVHE
jgi:site-specific DNA-cytosine methylase